jgi:hypothetical protein
MTRRAANGIRACATSGLLSSAGAPIRGITARLPAHRLAIQASCTSSEEHAASADTSFQVIAMDFGENKRVSQSHFALNDTLLSWVTKVPNASLMPSAPPDTGNEHGAK